MKPAWKRSVFRHGPVSLEYQILAGADKPWLVFFHGFGQDYTCFEPMYEQLKSKYNFLAVHLPFHGNSCLSVNGPLTPEDWTACLESLFLSLKIGKPSAIGFSLGARLMLTAAEKRPGLFSSICLLAPDGFAMNPWYAFATGSPAGRGIFRLLISLFPLFSLLLSLLAGLRIIRPAWARFARGELRVRKGRERVMAVWQHLRLLWPSFPLWVHACRRQNVPVKIILGRYDGILPVSLYKKFMRESDHPEWEVLACGHAGLISAYADGMEKS